MIDDTRADRLERLIAGGEPLFDERDDEELIALAALGAELDRLGPRIAAIAQAADAFDPAFARRLKSTLLAEQRAASGAASAPVLDGTAGTLAHPAEVGARDAETSADGMRTAGAREIGARRPWPRRALGFGLAALAALAVVLAILLHGGQPALQFGASGATATPRAQRFDAIQSPRPAAGTSVHDGTQGPTNRPIVPRPMAGMAVRPSPTVTKQPGAPESLASSGATSAVTPPLQTGISPRHAAAGVATAGGTNVAGISPSLALGGVLYRLPAVLPRMPATVPVYSLRSPAFTPAELRALLASFPELRLQSSAGNAARIYSDRHARLVVVLASGDLRYNAAGTASAHGGSLAPEAALVAAHQWLTTHHLYPRLIDETATQVTPLRGGGARVRFLPALPLPLAGTSPALSLSVDLDRLGAVVAAASHWPDPVAVGTVVVQALAVALRSPAVAGPAIAGPHQAPARPAFYITTASLVYRAVATGGTVRLRPAYLLTGHLVGSSQPLSQLVMAEAG